MRPMLFDPDAHEALVDTAWEPAAVERAIHKAHCHCGAVGTFPSRICFRHA
jgi:hypothetical protein